jgi:hypothetical protein
MIDDWLFFDNYRREMQRYENALEKRGNFFGGMYMIELIHE